MLSACGPGINKEVSGGSKLREPLGDKGHIEEVNEVSQKTQSMPNGEWIE